MRNQGLFASRRLAECRGRDNNFNLIRVLAATLVIWTHAFGLTERTNFEPLYNLFGIGAGDIGVNIFFVLSGFLVSKSFEGKGLGEFAWARSMRIYPALWTSVLLSVLAVGVIFQPSPLLDFLRSHGTLDYLGHNFAVLPGVGAREKLPGAFGLADPLFNVPLWTLPHEIEMYVLLALIGVALGVRGRYLGTAAVAGACIVALDKFGTVHLLSIDSGRFMYFFFAGATIYAMRERIILTWRIALPLACALLGTIFVTRSYFARELVLALVLPYLIIWCAYVPSGFIRRWNRLGDYSYGMYIYACPIQVALIRTGMAQGPLVGFALAMATVIPIAALSWHVLEQRALKIAPPPFLTGIGRRFIVPARKA